MAQNSSTELSHKL